jgi:Fe-S cluster assembly iron-binding protein IscA
MRISVKPGGCPHLPPGFFVQCQISEKDRLLAVLLALVDVRKNVENPTVSVS